MFRSLVFFAATVVAPIMLPPDAPPKILSVELSASVVHAGDIVQGKVIASSNVASVEVRVANVYSVNMNKVGIGKFIVTASVPQLPPILHRTYSVAIIARNTSGASTERTTSITIE